MERYWNETDYDPTTPTEAAESHPFDVEQWTEEVVKAMYPEGAGLGG